jgi:hypothetical protein
VEASHRHWLVSQIPKPVHIILKELVFEKLLARAFQRAFCERGREEKRGRIGGPEKSGIHRHYAAQPLQRLRPTKFVEEDRYGKGGPISRLVFSAFRLSIAVLFISGLRAPRNPRNLGCSQCELRSQLDLGDGRSKKATPDRSDR